MKKYLVTLTVLVITVATDIFAVDQPYGVQCYGFIDGYIKFECDGQPSALKAPAAITLRFVSAKGMTYTKLVHVPIGATEAYYKGPQVTTEPGHNPYTVSIQSPLDLEGGHWDGVTRQIKVPISGTAVCVDDLTYIEVNCLPKTLLEISKTAAGSREVSWQVFIDKQANPAEQEACQSVPVAIGFSGKAWTKKILSQTGTVSGVFMIQNVTGKDGKHKTACIVWVKDVVEASIDGSWIDIQTTQLKGEFTIEAGAKYKDNYSVNFTPATGATAYRNRLEVLLKNHLDGEHLYIYREPFTIEETGEVPAFTVTDLISPTQPLGTITGEGELPFSYTVEKTFNQTGEMTVTNTATITGAGKTASAAATAKVTVEACEDILELTTCRTASELGKWRVTNPNDHIVAFSYKIDDGDWSGSIAAPANNGFYEGDGPYPGTVFIKYIINGQETLASAEMSSVACQPKPVRPLLECVDQNVDGTYTAWFGYQNENGFPVTIPVGPQNKLTPAPEDRGQPTMFQSGRTPDWPHAAYPVNWSGGNLAWTLTGPDGSTWTSTASPNSTPCSYHIFFEKVWQDADGKPLPVPKLPANYRIVAHSDFGEAIGTSQGGKIVFVYNNQQPPAIDNNGLWVPYGSSYSVVEENLPSSFAPLVGTGVFVAGDYAEFGYQGIEKYALHRVVNQKEPGGLGCPPIWHETEVWENGKPQPQYLSLFTGLDFSNFSIATRLVLANMCQVDNEVGRIYDNNTAFAVRQFLNISQLLSANPNFITFVSVGFDIHKVNSLGTMAAMLDSARALMTHPRYYFENGHKQLTISGNNADRLTPEKLMTVPEAKVLASYVEFNWPVPENMVFEWAKDGYHSVYPSREETTPVTMPKYLTDYYRRSWSNIKAAGMFADSTQIKKAKSYREVWSMALNSAHDGRWFMQSYSPTANATVIETDLVNQWALTWTSKDSAELVKGDCTNHYEKWSFYALLKLWNYHQSHPELRFEEYVSFLHKILNHERDLGLPMSATDYKLVYTGIGTPAHTQEPWENAVDGDLTGWDGTATVKGPSGWDNAWGIFQFASGEEQDFLFVQLQTGNEESDQDPDRLTKEVQIWVSKSGTAENDFILAAKLKIKSSDLAIYKLQSMVRARYIKFVIPGQGTRGGWRQLVEVSVSTDLPSKGRLMSDENEVVEITQSTNYSLDQNYPNPFNPATTITFTAPQGELTLAVYNSAGQMVRRLVSGYQPAGSQSVVWDGCDEFGNQVSSGVYHLIMLNSNIRLIRKIMFIK